MQWRLGGGVMVRVMNGIRAFTTQPYTEVNVKRGMQYYVRAAWPTADPIVNGEAGSRLVWFRTGAKPVAIKMRGFQYIAEEIRLALFRAPTGVTGGTALSIGNYNAISPVASGVQCKKNVSVATLGTMFSGGDPEYFFGANAVGNRSSASIPEGRERILPPNTEFIVQITNLSSGPGRAEYFLDWYEGDFDIPNTDFS